MKALPVMLISLMLLIVPSAMAESTDYSSSNIDIDRILNNLLVLFNKAFSFNNPTEVFVQETAIPESVMQQEYAYSAQSFTNSPNQEALTDEEAKSIVKNQLKLNPTSVKMAIYNGRMSFIVTGGTNDENEDSSFEAEIDPYTSEIRSLKVRTTNGNMKASTFNDEFNREYKTNREYRTAEQDSVNSLQQDENSHQFPIGFFQHTTINNSRVNLNSTNDVFCIQAITPAKNPETGECRQFPTPCEVPRGWEKGCNTENSFNSEDELIAFIRNNTLTSGKWMPMDAAGMQNSQEDHSTTNIQVEGVDEADIVKNDGKYIYMLSNNKLIITEAYPAEGAKVISEIPVSRANNIFLNNDKLIIFGQNYEYAEFDNSDRAAALFMPWRIPSDTYIKIYDIEDRSNPALKRELIAKGYYSNSRMVGDYAYLITGFYAQIDPLILPSVKENGAEEKVPANEIRNLGYPDYSYEFVNIISINTQNDDEKYEIQSYLSGSSKNMYASQDNIYLTHSLWRPIFTPWSETPLSDAEKNITPPTEIVPAQKTSIDKIGINLGKIHYAGQNNVPGTILNQFSMDENNGFFRIATTTELEENNIYVLDSDMKLAGKLEGLAKGERIYSTRFMRDRAYMVTFKNVDPLFTIDLSDPYNPKLLGKLKIPGYSDYIHPYDENHIIGIGKDAVESEEGDFAWYQGIKIALFDVSDPTNPREISKYNIGDRGTDSYALQDHKAFLFDREKNLLAIPITLAEIDKSKYAEGNIPPNAYGEFKWQGAYVFGIDAKNGFELKGRVTHYNAGAFGDGYYPYYAIKRTLFIGNVLYTLSDKIIKMNDLDSMQEINQIGFEDYEKGTLKGKVTIGPLCPVEIACASENQFCGGISGIRCCSGSCKLDGDYPDSGGVCVQIEKYTNCIQLITPARNPETSECREFPTPCEVPQGWVKTQFCSAYETGILETYPLQCDDNPEAYANRRIVIYPKNQVLTEGMIIANLNGQHEYSIALEAGAYTVDVTDYEGNILPSNESRGPGNAYPQTAQITAGTTTILDFDIDTGIR